MQRQVEAEPVPRVERRDRVHVADPRRLGRVGLEQGPRQDLVDPQRAADDRDVAGDARRLVAPLQPHRRVDVDRPQVVAHHLEMVRGPFNLQIAHAKLVRAEAAVHVERAAVGVLDVQGIDRDALAGQGQRRPDVLVFGSGRDDLERRVGDRDGAAHVRVVAGADRLDVERDVAAHVADHVGDPFDEAEADRAGLDREVNRLIGRARVHQAERHLADGGDPDAGRLVEPRVDVEHLRAVGEARLQLLVADALDAAVDDGQGAGRLQAIARAANDRVEIDDAAVAGRPFEGRLQRVQEQMARGDVQRAAAVGPPRAGDAETFAVGARDELDRRCRDLFVAPRDHRRRRGRDEPPGQRAEGDGEIDE